MDFEIYSGDSKNLLVTVTDENNNPVNITGAQSIVWALISGDKVILRKTLSEGEITIIDGLAGMFKITLQSADTVNLAGQYQHECRLVTADGASGIIFTGTLTVNKAYI